MTTNKIILITVSAVGITLITISQILARKAYLTSNKKLAKKARLFEIIGTTLATFALGMTVRVLFFT